MAGLRWLLCPPPNPESKCAAGHGCFFHPQRASRKVGRRQGKRKRGRKSNNVRGGFHWKAPRFMQEPCLGAETTVEDAGRVPGL